MYIITPTGGLEKNEDKICRVYNKEHDAEYIRAGCQRQERIYKLKYEYTEYSVVCYEYRKDGKGEEPIVIIPDFLLPGRPYIACVYLYAIDIYSMNPEKGQRWAAEETRKRFKLPTFAHTTLGRALKSFANRIAGTEKSNRTASDVTTEANERIESVPLPELTENIAIKQNSDKRASIPTVKSTNALRSLARSVLSGKFAAASMEKIIENGCELVMNSYLKHQRLLL
jgi:hypothetical protein